MLVMELSGVKPLTANVKQRMQHRERSTAVNAIKGYLGPAMRQTVGPSPTLIEEPVRAVLEVQPDSRRHMDADGWAPTLKAALDVAVAQGLLPDDCTCWVKESTCRALDPGDRWLIRLYLHPVRLSVQAAYGVTT